MIYFKKNCAHVIVSGGRKIYIDYGQLYVNYLFILTNASWFYRGLKLTRLLSLRAIASSKKSEQTELNTLFLTLKSF